MNGSPSPEHHAVAELILAKGQTSEQIARTLGLSSDRVERLAREAAAELAVAAGSQGDEARALASGTPAGAQQQERQEHAEANRRTAPMFALYLAAIAAGIAAAIALGLVREADDPAAGDTVARFSMAIERKDGEAACEQLSEDTQSKLESQEKRPCEEAILTLELSGGEVVNVDVAETSAAVDLDAGGRAYLDKTPHGWRISAGGCDPLPGQPYDCELES